MPEVNLAEDTKVLKSGLVKIHPPSLLATEDRSEVTHSDLDKAGLPNLQCSV